MLIVVYSQGLVSYSMVQFYPHQSALSNFKGVQENP